MTDIEKELTELSLSLGAKKCAVIKETDVVCDRAFRAMCEKNVCGKYGRCYACPPDVGDIDERMNALTKYGHVFVYQTVGDLEDSFDIENMSLYAKKHNELTVKIKRFLKSAGYTDALVLGAGGCSLCERCAKITGEPCRHEEDRIESLESYGVHVSRLAESAGMKYINGQNTVTYFGAVFY